MPLLLAVGHDLVSLAALAPRLARERFVARVFTEDEAAYARAQADPLASFGARWAAKEAAVKALSQVAAGLGAPLPPLARLRDYEVVARDGGRAAPELRLHGRPRALLEEAGGEDGLVLRASLTHEGGFASAVVVIAGATAAPRPAPAARARRPRKAARTA